MTTSTPRRAGGRTLIDLDPDQLIWVLLARESTDRERQLDNQLTDLRAQVAKTGGRIDREIPENAVSAFKRQRVALPDGTFGFPTEPILDLCGRLWGVGRDHARWCFDMIDARPRWLIMLSGG